MTENPFEPPSAVAGHEANRKNTIVESVAKRTLLALFMLIPLALPLLFLMSEVTQSSDYTILTLLQNFAMGSIYSISMLLALLLVYKSGNLLSKSLTTAIYFLGLASVAYSAGFSGIEQYFDFACAQTLIHFGTVATISAFAFLLLRLGASVALKPYGTNEENQINFYVHMILSCLAIVVVSISIFAFRDQIFLTRIPHNEQHSIDFDQIYRQQFYTGCNERFSTAWKIGVFSALGMLPFNLLFFRDRFRLTAIIVAILFALFATTLGVLYAYLGSWKFQIGERLTIGCSIVTYYVVISFFVRKEFQLRLHRTRNTWLNKWIV